MKDEIFELIQKSIINLDNDELKELYNYWNSNEEKRNHIDFKEFKDLKGWIRNKGIISKNQFSTDNAVAHGIDLPYWFNHQNPENRIMIIGIDPLRSKKEFIDIKNDVIIGTPYAVHSEKFRKGRTKEYWNFISSLKEQNVVYLTDVFKLYFIDEEKKTRSYNYLFENYRKENLSILRKEIEILNPTIIITLGKLSFELLTGKKLKSIVDNVNNTIHIDEEFNSIPIIPLVHLSGAVRKSQKLKFLEMNEISNNESIGKSYASLVKDFLKIK
ncbi:uracil-DNA glycosylase family protein [Empedobacter brevis]|uniref:uracil-DNA glycosylase family protein n=1 Tax=Empedobacter brevis TaxID=247 RepID=UPI00289C0DEF|nr:uracil-DNA glycosylase family protein [Empedobacter brevis]